MKFTTFLILLFLATAAIFSHHVRVSAQDTEDDIKVTDETEESEEVVEEIILGPSPHVSTSFLFPETTNGEFLVGKEATVILGFTNNGKAPFNVSAIFASLRYPIQWSYHIQNYTGLAVFETVQPSEEASFIYKFQPDALLEPTEFGLQIDVYYSDLEGNNFTSAFFNSTVSLVEAADIVDAQQLFTYIGIVAIAGLLLFIVYKASKGDKKKKSKPVEMGTSKKVDNEWLEGTNVYANSPKRGRAQTKKTN